MKKLYRRLLVGIAAVLGVWLGAAGILIATSAPQFAAKPYVVRTQPSAPCLIAADTRCYTARDGSILHADYVAASADDKPVIVLLHGVMSSAHELRPAAQALHDVSGAAVVSVDLRGHGASSGRFGDIDYIGQYEDDVADVVAALRREQPSRKLVLAGHSMGGGVALRYAAKKTLPSVDGYLLFAPHLGDGAPTTPRESAPAPGAPEAPIKLHLRRTLGLVMFNAFGIRVFNGLGTLYFNVADTDGLLHYSFRAMLSCAPDDYRAALGADDKPLLILAGSRDEAFNASAYPDVAGLHRGGTAVLVDGATHDGILSSPLAMASAANWLR